MFRLFFRGKGRARVIGANRVTNVSTFDPSNTALAVEVLQACFANLVAVNASLGRLVGLVICGFLMTGCSAVAMPNYSRADSGALPSEAVPGV